MSMSVMPRTPLLLSRRQLLRMLGLTGVAGFGATVAGGCAGADPDAAAPAVGAVPTALPPAVRTKADAAAPRSLVVIELEGGHDGFAMLVPYGDARFRRLRDHIWVDPKDLHVLDDRYALAKGLAPVEKNLAFVEGVGVAKPDLSHSAMLQRWWHGDPEGSRGLLTGFLGRCCDAALGAEPVTGVSIGGGSTPSLGSSKATTVSLPKLDAIRDLMKDEPEQRRLRTALATVAGGRGGVGDPASDAWFDLARAGLRAGLDLSKMIGGVTGEDARYPQGNDLGAALASVRQLISAGSGVRVFHIPWGDFDTHTNEVGTHTDHMNRLGVALAAFRDDLAAHGLSDRVLVATTSEFGRRPEANGGGTDHGTASTMLLMGSVTSGRHGLPVDFARLDENGNAKATVSMADYYVTLAGWLGVRPEDAMAGVQGSVIASLGAAAKVTAPARVA